MRYLSALAVGALAVSFVLVACGSDDPKPAPRGSYAAVANKVANPTGTLSAANAVSVAEAYEQIETSGASGKRIQGGSQTSTQQYPCPEGGSYSMTANSDGSSGSADVKYDNCCYSAGCCMNGNAQLFFSTSTTTTDSYSLCETYNISLACGDDSGTLAFDGCMGSSGEWTYVVTVDGKTYSISGTYTGGSGTLTITDSKDTWTCTYSDGTGSCTGTSGTITF
jgi:hypothetical protein